VTEREEGGGWEDTSYLTPPRGKRGKKREKEGKRGKEKEREGKRPETTGKREEGGRISSSYLLPPTLQ
jgi:hypothetical protein